MVFLQPSEWRRAYSRPAPCTILLPCAAVGAVSWKRPRRCWRRGACERGAARFAAAACVVLSRRPLGKEASALWKPYFEVAGFISFITEAAR